MNKKVKILSILLTAIVGTGCSSTSTSSVVNEAAKHLVVRHVLRQNATDNTGAILNVTEAPVANNVVSDVLAQVNTPENDKVNIRFVAGIDSYAYGSASFNITLKNSEGTVVKEERSYTVSSAYLGVEVEGETVYATNTEYFGEGCNYLIAYTLTDVPEDYWNYQFDVTASVGETGKSANVKTKVASEMVDYNVKVNMFNVDGTKLGSKYEKVAVDSLYTVTAPEVEGLVASHDYVKGYLTEGKTTHNIYYSEVDVWDGSSVSASFEEAGTEADPYLISSAADFALLKQQAAEGNTYEGYYFKMTKSVDFAGANFIVDDFAGVFDGNNCTVRGFVLDKADYTGLFSKTSGGEVKNISTYGEVYGWGTVGSIVGQSSGLLTNCTNYATVYGQSNRGGIAGITNAKVTNCVNYGESLEHAGGWTVGGLIGCANADVVNCANFGVVTGTTSHVGGLIGNAAANVLESANYGPVSGMTIGGAGLVANLLPNATIDNCVNRGDVTQNVTTSVWTGSIGGIAGKYQAGSSIKNSINYGNLNLSISDVSKSTGVGGIVGAANASADTVSITNCDNYGDITSVQPKVAGIVGDLKVNSTLENCDNYGDISGCTNTSAGIVGLAASNVTNCDNYGNVSASSWNVGGIVGRNANTSTVSNCENHGTIVSTGGTIGGISGTNQGTVTGCTNNGSVTCSNQAGGIVGNNQKAIINCVNNGVTTITNGTEVGGIFGKNTGTYESCVDNTAA